MKTLMIVEDEKVIRAGLRSMVSNSPVKVEDIIECKNGVEAMEILQSRAVDVMITDIRMPKMDGIELVRRACELPSPPIMVVISGYSEFDYAVDVFRQGVRDYLLKPIERERVYELMISMQEELDAKSTEAETRQLFDSHVLRSVMLGIETEFLVKSEPGGYPKVPEKYRSLLSGGYFAVCLAPCHIPKVDYIYCFDDVGGQTVLLVPEASLASMTDGLLKGKSAGISGVKCGLDSLREAYMESLQARKRAFIMSSGMQENGDMPSVIPHKADKGITAEQVAQTLGAGKRDEAVGLLERMLFLAQNKHTLPDAFLGFIEELLTVLKKTFAHVSFAMGELENLTDILSFENASQYNSKLVGWMNRLSDFLDTDRENRNVCRIRVAVGYIGEHFRSQINMAVVSNYISMNYTQFSNLFKQHTGSSFSEYLKSLRLNESRRLLADPALSIRKAGELSGFMNEKHFIRCFKQETGVSPGDYRRNLHLHSLHDQAHDVC